MTSNEEYHRIDVSDLASDSSEARTTNVEEQKHLEEELTHLEEQNEPVDTSEADEKTVIDNSNDGSDNRAETEDIGYNRSNQPLFSWRDVSLVVDFTLRFQSASSLGRSFFKNLLDVPEEADVVDISASLYPPTDRKMASEFLSRLITRIHENGQLTAMDGVRLANEVGEMDVETIRVMSKMLNTLSQYFTSPGKEIDHFRYRKNIPTIDVIERFIVQIENLDTDIVTQYLSWVENLLSIWPGEAL